MAGSEKMNEKPKEGHKNGTHSVSGKPTKGIFSLMEEEVGGATPEPSIVSDFNREFVYNEIAPKDYHSSNFPSLMSRLGPSAKQNTKRNTTKKQWSDEDVANEKSRGRRHKQDLTFAEQMRRRNEAQWLRIEAVAKEKLDYHDKYMADMRIKLKHQRTKINKRTEQLLLSLQKQEEKPLSTENTQTTPRNISLGRYVGDDVKDKCKSTLPLKISLK